MAVYSGTPVVNRRWKTRGLGGFNRSGRQLQITLATQGGLTNNIPALALGFVRIDFASMGILTDNSKAYGLSPSADGSLLLVFKDGADTPSDISGTLQFTIEGQAS